MKKAVVMFSAAGRKIVKSEPGKFLLFGLTGIFIVAVAVGIITFFIIFQEVKSMCILSKQQYPAPDCLVSLIQIAQSESQPYRLRNSAIWTMGQLADPAALPFLYSLQEIHSDSRSCSFGSSICFYEVQKAIRWCESGNVTSWMYRNRNAWSIDTVW